jgi:hypothetical protein
MIILRKNDITRSTLLLPHFLRFSDHQGEHMTGRMPALFSSKVMVPRPHSSWDVDSPSFTRTKYNRIAESTLALMAQ